MRAARFFAVWCGVWCVLVAATGIAGALQTGEPLWQPVVVAAVMWMVTTAACVVGNWAFEKLL